jgi:glycosyltransferase involved in cell wall biosynthesis
VPRGSWLWRRTDPPAVEAELRGTFVDVPIYYLLSSVDVVRGGLTRSVLARAGMLARRRGVTARILTFNFDPDLSATRAALIEHGILDPAVPIRNVFSELAGPESMTDDLEAAPPEPHIIERPGRTVEVVGPQARRIFENGLLREYREQDDEGRLRIVDRFDETRRRLLREQYDHHGRVRRVVHMDPVRNTPQQARFFDGRGRCFATIWYDPKSRDSVKALWFDEYGELRQAYPNETALRVAWLERIAAEHERVIFQAEQLQTEDLMLQVDRPHLTRVKMMHSSHLRPPFTYGSPVTDYHGATLKRLDRFDAFVVATRRQRDEIARQFGPRPTLHAIPHPAPTVAIDDTIVPDPATCVYVGRLVRTKRVDEVVRAFAAVAEAVPEARLQIWGFGPEEGDLRRLIGDLGLNGRVSLCGFADDAMRVFAGAAFSVFSGTREGFGLTIAESMAAGTPVVAYDIPYGPREMIRDGIDGLLVPPHDLRRLADAMVRMFTDRPEREAMAGRAPDIVDRLSEERFLDRWMAVYGSALERAARRVDAAQPQSVLHEVAWTEEGRIGLRAGVAFDHDAQEHARVAISLRPRRRAVDAYVPAAVTWASPRRAVIDATLDPAALGRDGAWSVLLSVSEGSRHWFVRLPATERRIEEHPVGPRSVRPYATRAGHLGIRVRRRRPPLMRWARRAIGSLRR